MAPILTQIASVMRKQVCGAFNYDVTYLCSKATPQRLRRSPVRYEYLHQWKWVDERGNLFYLFALSRKDRLPKSRRYRGDYLGAIKVVEVRNKF
jgi:hypothetical protein